VTCNRCHPRVTEGIQNYILYTSISTKCESCH
jgi:hypothetical protein